ncbi:HNH endonuclease signature motif containing protein [Algoriphagus sp. D3-2-R+10]|uniref:HNH endonuclease n=1 Tax=Algoriphagus aurantiacus TaxID=3103948 RepID=UPI002B391703|nr:HNH endonuclease signature motif containing protein [Algoriphagus sp. D3-2-R+10]MEB2775240.1 HNH endonuclease signature motif containing protein [Algoriphagus sp. D3-2-R+10]
MKYKNKSWGKDTGFYRRRNWRVLREIKINQNPICELCNSINITTPAVYVDHILNRNLFKEYELETDNLQSLCPTCHSQKTRLELLFESSDRYLKEFDSGKLQYICTIEAKEKLLNLLR